MASPPRSTWRAVERSATIERRRITHDAGLRARAPRAPRPQFFAKSNSLIMYRCKLTAADSILGARGYATGARDAPL